MKIEKINENQIRCTLTKHDLADRELKISELAYGSEKAKILFRDMMEQASYECGFEADDIPLMIEAVPINAECIVLTITKVEDPEELDTRFSKFAPSVHEDSFEELDSEDITDEVMNLFQNVQDAEKKPAPSRSAKSKAAVPPEEVPSSRVYRFMSLNHVIRLAHVVADMELCANSLYKDVSSGEYRLIIHSGHTTAQEFNRFCHILSEYGCHLKNSAGGDAYLKEHFTPICLEHALQSLAVV